ncbi:reverse transcriptase domain-containing protein [Tanacetum coccineum]
MTVHHNDWDTSAHRGESSSSTTSSSSEIAALTQQMTEIRKEIIQMYHLNQQVNSVTHSSLMPKYAKMLKDLLFDKGKLLGLANTSLTKNCLAVLLKKLLEKLGDPGKFLIPCDFPELEKCMALADIGASINLIPLYVWKKLMLPELVPTRITLELANRSIAYPADIAEDVFVQVGKFTFPVDFVVVNYDVDPHVPLILGRPFLRTARALVDVYREELILRDDDEKLIFHADSTSKYPHKHGNELINTINFIDITCEDHFNETSDSLLEEFTDELALIESFPPRNDDIHFDAESYLRELEYLLNRDPSIDSSPKDNIEKVDSILEELAEEPSLEFPEIDTLPSFPSKNKDKVFNPGILVYGSTYFVTNKVTQDKNLKEKTSSEALLILEDSNFLPLSSDRELLFHLELSVTETLLSFSSKNEDISILRYSFQKDSLFHSGIISSDL